MTLPRVLVVEDEPVIQSLYRAALADLCDLDCFAEGAPALDALATTEYAAVLLDLSLSGPLRGDAFWRIVAERRSDLARRVIFCTGGTASAATAAFLESTGCRVLWKPFDLSTLRATVTEVAGAATPRAGAECARPA